MSAKAEEGYAKSQPPTKENAAAGPEPTRPSGAKPLRVRTRRRTKHKPPQMVGQFVPHKARRINTFNTPGPGAYESTSSFKSQVLSKNSSPSAYSFRQAPKQQFEKQFYSSAHQIKSLPGSKVTANIDYRQPGRWEIVAKSLDMPESSRTTAPSFQFSADTSQRLDITKWKVINGFLMRDSDLDGTPNVDFTVTDSCTTSFGRKHWAPDSPTFKFGTGTREQRARKQLHNIAPFE